MSVDEVAERLGLHPRTVRGYIRSGRLNATRIGKQYRVTPTDFAALTARPLSSGAEPQLLLDDDRSAAAGPDLVVDSTAVVQVDGLNERLAERLTTHLSATAYGAGVRADLTRTPGIGRLKIVVSGDLAATNAFLSTIEQTVEALRAET